MSVNEKMTAIADKIRFYCMTYDRKYSLDDMVTGVTDTFEEGKRVGRDSGYDEGVEAGINSAQETMDSYSLDLSGALTSGYSNSEPLSVNVSQARNDIFAIKELIESHGVEVSIGTLSSTYDETIEQIITEEKLQERADGYVDGYSEGEKAGEASAEQRAMIREQDMSVSLSEALTSGGSNNLSLDDNLNQAKKDIKSIKEVIVANDIDVPVGTESSTYAELVSGLINSSAERGSQTRDENFWKVFQNEGKRTNYQYAFQSGWNADTFNPKYDITPTGNAGANNMFGGGGNTKDLDLRESTIGVKIDFSQCTSFNNTFSYASSIVALGIVDTRSAASCSNMFNSAYTLHTVEKWILKDDGTQTSLNMGSAKLLANIMIEGVIGADVSFSSSPLTKTSIMGKLITSAEYNLLAESVKTNNVVEIDGSYYYGGIIPALKTGNANKLTLKKSAVDTAFETSVGVADGSDSTEWIALITPKSNEYNGTWTISLI